MMRRLLLFLTVAVVAAGGMLHGADALRPVSPASDPLRLGADRLHADRYQHIVDASTSRYVRLQVLDKSGAIVGESNPLWILREPPADGIPEARRIKTF